MTPEIERQIFDKINEGKRAADIARECFELIEGFLRLQQLKDREEIGKSTGSEVCTAKK